MPSRTAAGIELQLWVESNHGFLWISLHFSNNRMLPSAARYPGKIGAGLIYICNKSRRTLLIH